MQTAELDITPAIIEDTWNYQRSDDMLRAFIDEHFHRLERREDS